MDNQNGAVVTDKLLSIEKRLKKLIVSTLNLDIDPEELDPLQENFLDAFGFNSLDAVQILVNAESEFDMEFDDDDLGEELYKTVRAISTYIYTQLEYTAKG